MRLPFSLKILQIQNIEDMHFDTSAYFGATEDVWGFPRWAGVNLLVRF